MNEPVTVPGAQLVMLNAFCPFGPVTVSVRLVSGRSGMLLNVTELLARFTAPSSVIPNGAGNDTAIVGVVAFPDRVTVPDAKAGPGRRGDVAVAVPIVQVVPARHPRSALTFGVIDLPRPSVMVLLAASVAPCVIPRTSSPP